MSIETLDRTDGPDEDDAEEFSQEVVFEMLSNRRRRFVVHYLLDAEEASELRDISRAVAAWENDKDPNEISSQERRRVYNALQQAHLPKMDQAGLVHFDASRGVVEASNALADLQVYLEIVPGDEIPWSEYYLLLGVLCGSMTLAGWVGLFPFDRIPGLALAGVISLLFVLSGLAHVYHGRKMRLGADERPPSTNR